jgi:hypothetical protein
MWITGVAPVRCDVACPWEPNATHIAHAVTPHGVAGNVRLFILAVSLRGLLTIIGGNLD